MRTTLALLLCGASLVLLRPARAQFTGLPPTEVALTKMDAFRPTAGNWQVAGGLACAPRADRQLSGTAGTGILVNQPTSEARDNLFTTWTHGDIELELDFLVPKGSNAGVYLQGRYEVQILDSWGVEEPQHADCGGIYQRWDETRPEGQRGYEGHPPRRNASRAPCLWQHYRIVFRAPRFDDQGRKTDNARFVEVWHNGVLIHEDVEVTGPTRAAAFADEQPMGPLMIQGDHGPVALRRIRYKLSSDDRTRLTDLRYRYYEGSFPALPDPDTLTLTLTSEGTAPKIDGRLAAENQHAMAYAGTLHVPRPGPYRFDLGLRWVDGDPHFQDSVTGGGALLIDGDTVVVHTGRGMVAGGSADLDAGIHPFRLLYYKSRGGGSKIAQLYVEGPSIPRHTLHEEPDAQPIDPIYAEPAAEPAAEPTLVRSFMTVGDAKRTHMLSVGDPSGLHYSADLNRAAVVQVWRGDFLETTPMWHSRGTDQLALPRATTLNLPEAPAVAALANPRAAWPTAEENAQVHSYDLDQEGRPVLRYHVGPVRVIDRLLPTPDGRLLTRSLAFDGSPPTPLWHRAAVADRIEPLPDGSYLIGDHAYFVAPKGPAEPLVRASGGQMELLLPVSFDGGTATLEYDLIY